MAAIDTWTNTDPTEASDASALDDSIRSFAISVQSGLGEELNWPSTETKAFGWPGTADAGTARMSTASAAKDLPDGILTLGTTRGAVYHSGSASSSLVMHNRILSHGSVCEAGDVWLHQSGSESVTPASGLATLRKTFATAYQGTPCVLLYSSNTRYLSAITLVNTTLFGSIYSNLDNNADSTGFTVYWQSEGTVAQ